MLSTNQDAPARLSHTSGCLSAGRRRRSASRKRTREPSTARLGAKGRAELLECWSNATMNVRVLPEDVAREFPDAETTSRRFG